MPPPAGGAVGRGPRRRDAGDHRRVRGLTATAASGPSCGHRGHVVNAKKVRRLMRENDFNPRTKRRLAPDDRQRPRRADLPVRGGGDCSRCTARTSSGSGDITYVAIATGFVYLTVILDAWSRRVIGHALARNLEARHTVAALARAIALRRPLPGCVFHSDRGAQYASGAHPPRLLASARPHRLDEPHHGAAFYDLLDRVLPDWERGGAYALSARPKVNSPPATTLENNEKFRPSERAENGLCREVGGATGTAVEQSLGRKPLILSDGRFPRVAGAVPSRGCGHRRADFVDRRNSVRVLSVVR